MKELSDTKPTRPLVLGNDTGVINNLLGFLNNPEITGAEAPKQSSKAKKQVPKQPAEPVADAEPSEPASEATALSPAPSLAAVPSRIFLTGRPGSGRKFIASQIGGTAFSLDAGVRSLISTLSGGRMLPDAIENLVPETRSIGCGEVVKPTFNQLFLLSLISRAIDSNALPEVYSAFGSEYFWVKAALESIPPTATPPIIIYDVVRESDFKRLLFAGYSHYHIMCAPATPGKRGVVRQDSFAAALDNDVIKKISRERAGSRLRCVWNDVSAPPAPRFYSVADFVNQWKPPGK